MHVGLKVSITAGIFGVISLFSAGIWNLRSSRRDLSEEQKRQAGANARIWGVVTLSCAFWCVAGFLYWIWS